VAKLWTPRIVIDTREQCPLDLPNSEVGTLATGDYSIKGHEDAVCCERKSLDDLYGTVGHGRDRFIRELERMQSYRFRALVIEATLEQVLTRPPEHQHPCACHGRMLHPNSVVGSVLAWCWRYGIPPIFAGNRALAARVVECLCREAAKQLDAPRDGG